WLRSRSFLTGAGTIILACAILLWALLSFPRSAELTRRFDAARAEIAAQGLPPERAAERLAALGAEQASAELRASLGGRLGRAIEPALAPLGFDWKIGIGLIGAFAAREVFISTMGVVYGVEGKADEGSLTLRQKIRAETYSDGRPVYTPLVGLSLMV